MWAYGLAKWPVAEKTNSQNAEITKFRKKMRQSDHETKWLVDRIYIKQNKYNTTWIVDKMSF